MKMKSILSKFLAFIFLFLLVIFLLAFSIGTALVCSAAYNVAGMSTRIYHGLILGIFLGVPYALVLFVLLIVSGNKRRIVLLLGICFWIVFMALMFKPLSPSRLFKKVVKSPIPESVHDIRARMRFMANDHLHILNFKISEKDLDGIVKPKGFRRVQYLSCDDGVLEYRDSGHRTFPLKMHNQPPPWFKLEEWRQPEMYAVEIEEGYEQLLIYDSDLKEAYLIDYKWK
jgi:hypothetical protein